MRRRIWCETLTFEALTARTVVGLLAEWAVEPIIAVRPGQEPELDGVLRVFDDAGLRASVWPMLDDDHGRWGSAWNAEAYSEWAMRVVGAAGRRPGLEVFCDLEPPIGLLAAGFSHTRRASRRQLLRDAIHRRQAMADAAARFGQLASDIRRAEALPLAAVAPMLVCDSPSGTGRGWPAWQTLLGTPADSIGWESVNVMAYSSIASGWSRGLIRRRDAHAMVEQAAGKALARWGGAASVSLGAVGTGALGDEPVMGDVQELRQDVAAVRHAGIEDIALFELGGVLARGTPARWLEALGAAPSPAPRSARMNALVGACSTVSRAVALVSSARFSKA